MAKDLSQATRTLLVLTGVALMVNYVETMVIPGIPTIQKDLATTASIASWITAAYLIVGSAVCPLFGKLGDIYGKKRMFLVSLIFYMSGVAIAGFSPSIYFLIFARGLQGVGFAILPLSLAILTDVYPKERLGMAQGVISATFSIGAAAGLIIGSYVIQDLGWQYAFHTALILSIVLFFVANRIVGKDNPRAKQTVDYLGAAILMGGISLILVYVTEGPLLGWLHLEEIGFLVSGAILTSSFFVLESRSSNPLMHLELLRIRNVLVANLIGIFSGTILFLIFFAFVYYAEDPRTLGLNLDTVAAGLTIAPSCLAMIVVSQPIAKMMRNLGPKPTILFGSALQIVGLVLLIVNRTTRLDVAIDSIVLLAGYIPIIMPIVNMIAVSLPQENVSVGMGMNTMLRNLGGAIGPVVATTIMTTYKNEYFVAGHPTGLFFPDATSFNFIFIIGIVLSVCIVVISLTTRNYTFKKVSASVSNSKTRLRG